MRKKKREQRINKDARDKKKKKDWKVEKRGKKNNSKQRGVARWNQSMSNKPDKFHHRIQGKCTREKEEIGERERERERERLLDAIEILMKK